MMLASSRIARRALVAGLVLLALVATWLIVDRNQPSTAVQGAAEEDTLAQADDDSDEGANENEDLEELLESLAVTYDVFIARDPFESIRPEEVVAPTDPSDPSDPTDPTDPTDPADPTDPSDLPPTDPDDGLCRTGAEVVCDGQVLTLESIGDGQATFTVSGQSYVVAPGETFVTNFTLLRIADAACADVVYIDGDEADAFQVCVGDTTTK